MSALQYILFNDEKTECNVKSMPIFGIKRAIPHYSGLGEDEFERQLIVKMKDEGFKHRKCSVLQWLKSIFPENVIRHEKIRGFAAFIAYKLNDRLGRETYRRRSCILYWLQERIEEIHKLLSTNTMYVCCNDFLFKITPPPVSKKTIKSTREHAQTNTLQKNESPKTEEEINFDVYDDSFEDESKPQGVSIQ